MSDSDTNSDDSGYSSDEVDIDIHAIVLEGTPKEVDWALGKDRTKLLNLKQETTLRFAIHIAAMSGRMDMCTLLIKRGSMIDPKAGDGTTPLMLASAHGYTDIARMFLECGASIKAKDNSCWTALHHAVVGGHEECCVMLIKRGVDLSAEEVKFGKTALHFCAEQGLHELADTLIIRGADMYASGDSIYSKTPLHLASQLGDRQTTAILVRRGAELEAMSGFLDKTPLHLASEKGNLDSVQVLVEAGADMGAFGYNVNGSTPLHLAAQFGHEEVVKYLVSKGASMLTQGMYTVHGTAMHIAVQYGQLSVVSTMLELGADLEQKDMNGLTAMHTACKYKQWDIAFALIDKGASLMAEAHNGRYPLEFIPALDSYMKEKLRLAGITYDEEMERLAQLAASKMKEEEEAAARRQKIAEEEARLAAIALAMKQKREALFCSLLLAACNVSGELSALSDLSIEFSDLDINIVLDSTLGARAITRAAFNGFNVIVAALLKWEGIDINVQEKDGNTALHMAASRGKAQHKSIVEMLLLHNARIGIPNNAGKTAASVGCTSYISEIIRNPRLIQTRTQMEVLSMSPHMNNSRDFRAKSMGNAMATVTGGTANLLSLMSSTKIGDGMSSSNASANTLYSPIMTDPATLLLADAYGQNYSPMKPLLDTWKQSDDGDATGTKGMGTGPYANHQGQYGGMSSNNISVSKLGRNEFHYSDPNGNVPRGVPEVNEYGNIYLPPKFTTPQEINYQRELRGFAVNASGSMESGVFVAASTSMLSTQFNPGSMKSTLLPIGFGDFPNKTTTQYQLRDDDPGYVYSHTHFAETNKIPPMIDEKASKRLPKVDIDTENFTRGKFGAVPSSFRGCTDDLFFTKFNTEEEASEIVVADKQAKALLSSKLQKILDSQGLDYHGEEIDALINGDDINIKDTSRLGRVEHIQFELAKLRHQIKMKDIPAQAAHTPTTFDTTDEWIGVRDYLWLLGYPYARSDPFTDKRALLRNIAKVMGEMHRIFTDPNSLTSRWMDPLATEMNNRNNFSKSSMGSVRLHEMANLGDTRTRFIQTSSDEIMRTVGAEGLRKGSPNKHELQIGNGGQSESKSIASDADNVSIPGLALNNSNIDGGNAFGSGMEEARSPGTRGSRSPSPPKLSDANQFVFANQKNPTPASIKNMSTLTSIVNGPQTLAEAADLRLTQLCLMFVSHSIDVFAPQNGWPATKMANGSANFQTAVQTTVLATRITQVWKTGRMSEDLNLTLHKLLEAASKDVVYASTRPRSGKSKDGSRSQSAPMDANQALVFPPRMRRVLIDSLFEVAFAFKERAEVDFPVDSIRAHLWMHNGRKQYKRHIDKQEADTDMTLWLRDLHIEGTIVAFKQLGFKEMADFSDLSLEDVQEYFPFLKMGDAIRMARNIKLFTPLLLEGYKRRAISKDTSVGLPPIPSLIPSSPRKLQNNAAGKIGPTPSRKVKVVQQVVERPKVKSIDRVILDREPTREEYLGGIKISDYYLKQLQNKVSLETDGVNIRLTNDLEHAQDIIRKKGLVKQVIAREQDGKIVVVRASDISNALESVQAAITKATKGFQMRLKSDLTVANEIIREAGLTGLVICREDDKGDIQVEKIEDIGHAIQVLQEQISKATKGFQLRSASDLETADKMIREAGMFGIVAARETENGEIHMIRLHEDHHGPLWELYVNTISTIDTLDFSTNMDHQDPSVKVWLGTEFLGKTERAKDGRANATFTASMHMHLSEKTYNDRRSIIVEVNNESVTGALSHVGKGSVDLQRSVPKEEFNDYITIEIPLWYSDKEVEKDKAPHKETISDSEFVELQALVKKETEGFNARIASDLSHAKSMIKKREMQHLVVATEADNGDIILIRVDRQVGTVKLKVMVQVAADANEKKED